MRREEAGWLILALCAAVLLSSTAAYGQRLHVPGEIEQGEQLYQANCVTCHGLEGDEVRGVDLAHGQFRRASTDAELVKIIREGIPGTAMPANKLSEIQANNSVFYALDARTGALLRKATVGGVVASGPMTYAVGGRQYVAVAAGSSLFSFALR
jgi:hypothetical protein